MDGPDGVQVVLPAKYIAEAKMMPDARLDSEIATNEVSSVNERAKVYLRCSYY